MEKLNRYSIILLIVIVVFGCSDNPANNQNGEATLNISIDWNKVNDVPPERFSGQNSKTSAFTMMQSDSAHYFGVRVEYLADDAVFTQSVANTDGSNTDLITLNIPTADSVAVYAVGVNETHVVNMGVIKSAVLDEATEYNFTVDDFNWQAPSWGAGPDFDPDGWDTAYADKNNKKADIEFNVVNPYDTPVNPRENYQNFVIKLNGTGGIGDYQGDDVRTYRVVVEHSEAGVADTTTHSWNPYFDGAMFSLGNECARCVVDQRGTFTVYWE